MGSLTRIRAALAAAQSAVLDEKQREYSVERMLAFREYSDNVSTLRVALVLILTLSPSFLVLLLIDVIPLQGPSAGWSANVSFWIRTTITAVVVTGGVMTHAEALIPTLDLKRTRIFIIVAGTSIAYTGSVMLIGALWTFPVPFTMAVAASPWTTCLSVLVVLTDKARDHTQLRAFLRVVRDVGIQSSTIIVYGGYNAVFLKLRGPAQLAFVLLLPVLKRAFKILVAKLNAAIDGDLLLAVRSSIDIFDALYTTKCMQSAGSIEVGLGVIAIDVAINLHTMYAIAKRTQALRELFGAEAIRDTRLKGDAANRPKTEMLIPTAKERQRSSFFLQFLLANAKRLEAHSLRFASADRYNLSELAHPPRYPSDLSNGTTAASATHSDEAAARRQSLVREGMRLLHECESIAVIEYIETVVPVFYALYISVLFHLPNAQYYQDMRGVTADRLHTVALNILVYAAMELLSLMWVHRMLQRSFGVSLFRQLAFTLESEWRHFQAYFASWIVIIFQFLLVHFGTDMSFEFGWVSRGGKHHGHD